MRTFIVTTAALVAAVFLYTFGALGTQRSNVHRSPAFGGKAVILRMDDGQFSHPCENLSVQEVGKEAFLVSPYEPSEETYAPRERWVRVSRVQHAIVFDSLDAAESYHTRYVPVAGVRR